MAHATHENIEQIVAGVIEFDSMAVLESEDLTTRSG